MSEETLKYQKELIRDAIALLHDADHDKIDDKNGCGNLIDAILRLEEARDIGLATDEAAKVEIMNKWL